MVSGLGRPETGLSSSDDCPKRPGQRSSRPTEMTAARPSEPLSHNGRGDRQGLVLRPARASCDDA